jgi:hypothetical protein
MIEGLHGRCSAPAREVSSGGEPARGGFRLAGGSDIA